LQVPTIISDLHATAQLGAEAVLTSESRLQG